MLHLPRSQYFVTPTMFQVLFSTAKHFYSHFTDENLRQRLKEASQVIWLFGAIQVVIFSTPKSPWRLQGAPPLIFEPHCVS